MQITQNGNFRNTRYVGSPFLSQKISLKDIQSKIYNQILKTGLQLWNKI